MQQEYIRGISAWNFNLEDLKNQAALIQDYDDSSNAEDPDASAKQQNGHNDVGFPAERPSPEIPNLADAASHLEDELNDIPNLENSLAAFPIKPLQALKDCFDVCEDDVATSSPTGIDENHSDTEQQNAIKSSLRAEDKEAERNNGKQFGQSNSLPRSATPVQRKFSSGSLLPDNVVSPKKFIGDVDRNHLQPRFQSERNYSGPLQYRQKKDINNSLSADDVSEGAVVQRKGRFKVMSTDQSPKVPIFNPISGGITSPGTPSLPAASVLPSLQCILQQTTMQREEILKLIKHVEQTSVNSMEYAEARTNELSQIPLASPRERELQSQVIQLQQSIGSLVEKLQRQKMKNAQLEKKLRDLSKKDESIQK